MSTTEYWPVALVRYGRVPEVARFGLPDGMVVRRGQQVVVATPRGSLVGNVLEQLRRSPEPDVEQPETTGAIERLASEDDVATHDANETESSAAFLDWAARIRDWGITLELVDVELTLDDRTTLYVLNDRGAEPTKLALRAVTEHLGLIDVQPVTAEGVTPPETGGGCGSCSL